MLGVKSNKAPIKGRFAEKLRESIAVSQKEFQKRATQVLAKASVEAKR